MDSSVINQRVSALREVMCREHLSAFVFPSTDPHNGEYIPSHWEGRKWISGFDGSAGIAVVTMHEAALWTDSRYFLAAANQLFGTEFELMKERVEGTPTISEWLGMKLSAVESPEVGIDGTVNSYGFVEGLREELKRQGGITLRTNFDPLAVIWTDRPPIPSSPVEIQPLEFAGESCAAKLKRLRSRLSELNVEGAVVSALDDIAWTLNLRGSDVHCNPVFVSYLFLTDKKAILYVNPDKISAPVAAYLDGEGVELRLYDCVFADASSFRGYSVLMDPNQVNHSLYTSFKCPKVRNEQSPVVMMKAVKNASEIQGFRRAMHRDGVAMVKFLRWLKPAIERGGQTEISVAEKLHSLRSEQPLFRGDSFDTIAGYQAHGAIVHYEATSDTDVRLKSEGLILIDSGAHYQDGTTDITRTIALGDITEEQRHIYTLVLKGHIRLEMLKFPGGASGTQLDAVARMDMWREGLNFLHGTGHGVGSYLNVHEGPHQIRMEWKPAPMVEGMTVTDEPGLYLEGKFGVRTENTLLVTPYKATSFGCFLQFEPLTLCPIDKAPIDVGLLADEEVEWLNGYHSFVRNELEPLLDDDADVAWLREATRPIPLRR